MRHIHSRAIGAVTAVVMAVTATGIGTAPAFAATEKAPQAGVTTNTDISAAKKKVVRHRRGNGNAAALGAFVGIAGAIAGIAASQRNRDRYYDDGYYGYGYGGGPVYRGGGRHWRGGHVGRAGGGHIGGGHRGGGLAHALGGGHRGGGHAGGGHGGHHR